MYQIGIRAPAGLPYLLLMAWLAGCSRGRNEPGTAPSPATAGTSSRRGAMEVPLSDAYERAVAQGTRTHTGSPGPHYWQQWADYRLEAELNPISKRLAGKGAITYYNRSPDTLREVYVQLLHNIFAPNARHNTDVPWSVEGVELSRVAAQGQELKPSEKEAVGYQVDGTIMRRSLPQPLAPGESVILVIRCKLRITPDG